jgi:hypothetical protein
MTAQPRTLAYARPRLICSLTEGDPDNAPYACRCRGCVAWLADLAAARREARR